MNKVFFVTPNLNGKHLLKKSIPAAIETIKEAEVEAEVIVVDNGSSDSSKEFVQTFKRSNVQTKLVENTRNLGFATAVNQGIEQGINDKTDKSFVVVLNNDCVLDKKWLKEVLKTIEKGDDIASIQGRNLTADGKRIEGAGLFYFVKGKCLNRGNGEINEQRKYSKEEEVFGVSAAAALYRLSALEKIGFFDEDFFAFEEDVDLALRLKMAGFKSFYNPKAIARHIGGATVGKMGNLRARMDAKNWIFIVLKDYPLEIILKNFWSIFIERLRNLSGLVKQTTGIFGPWSLVFGLWSVFITYVEVIYKIPKMLAKRRGVKKDETIF